MKIPKSCYIVGKKHFRLELDNGDERRFPKQLRFPKMGVPWGTPKSSI